MALWSFVRRARFGSRRAAPGRPRARSMRANARPAYQLRSRTSWVIEHDRDRLRPGCGRAAATISNDTPSSRRDGGDVGDHAGPVHHHQPEGSRRRGARPIGTARASRSSWSAATPQVPAPSAGRAPGRSGRRRRPEAVGPAPAPRPSSITRPAAVAFHHHRVEHAVDGARSARLAGAPGRGAPAPRSRPRVRLRDAQQLDAVAQLVGERDVQRADPADALHVAPRRTRTGRVRTPARDRMASLCAASTPSMSVAGSSLRVTERLRFGEHVGEFPPLLAHGGQDVVAGAVEDAGDAVHGIGGEALANGLDDRDAASDRGLERQRGCRRPGSPVRRRAPRSAPCWRSPAGAGRRASPRPGGGRGLRCRRSARPPRRPPGRWRGRRGRRANAFPRGRRRGRGRGRGRTRR